MRKKGFTLIEVLAVMVVIAVILVIALPKMGDYIFQNKNQNFITSAQSIARELVYENMDYVSFDTAKISDIGIYDIDESMYDLDRSIIYIDDNEIYIDLVGKGTYEGLYVCNVSYQSKNLVVTTTPCEQREIAYVNLTVDLDGGTTTQQFKQNYAQGEQLTLNIPSKEGYTFSGWIVTVGNSVIRGNRLKIGSSATGIQALWVTHPTLTVNLNGGTTTQRFENAYEGGTQITLITPTKANSVFNGWTATGGLISGNNFTMGNTNTTLTANWLNYTTLTVNLNGGETTQTFNTTYLEGTTVSLTRPTKAGYAFAGWTTNNGTISGNNWIVGSSSSSTLTASWTGCGAGSYSSGSTCAYCPAGTYAQGTANVSCTACAAGSYAEGTGNTVCTVCENGTTTSSTGATSSSSCTACSNSEGAATWSTQTWSANSVTDSCTISTCAAGYKKEENVCVLDQVTCEAGQYLQANSITCSDCPAGSYCSGGTYTRSTTSDQGITPCEAGYYSDAANQTSCTACAAGSYAEGTGNTVCTVCGNGTTTSSTGATSSSSCTACSNSTGVATWSTQTWSANSVANLCVVSTCSAGYKISGSNCVTCGVAHATAYSSGCTPSACASGYRVSGNSCVLNKVNCYKSANCSGAVNTGTQCDETTYGYRSDCYSYNSSTNKCRRVWALCDSGWSYNSSRKRCEKTNVTPPCPSGSTQF